jgi:hypothetical protein
MNENEGPEKLHRSDLEKRKLPNKSATGSAQ